MSLLDPPKRPSQVPAITLLFVLIGGIGAGLWMFDKAHDSYRSNVPGRPIGEADAIFVAERPGRYELSYRSGPEAPVFEVEPVEVGVASRARAFHPLERLFHTSGLQGSVVHIEEPGAYRLSAQPWPEDADLTLAYADTQAVALWTLGGLLLVTTCLLLAARLVGAILQRRRL